MIYISYYCQINLLAFQFMAETERRGYAVHTQKTLIKAGYSLHKLLIADMAAIRVFDRGLDQKYADDFLKAIKKAGKYITDDEVVGRNELLTQAVNGQMKVCILRLKQSLFFIDKAFPDSKAIRNKFRYETDPKARQSAKLMICFMDIFYLMAKEYSTELARAGYNETQLKKIKEERKNLVRAWRKQELAVKNRPMQTEERHVLFSNVWRMMRVVSSAAKVVFEDDPEKYSQYKLPGSAEEAEEM